MSRIFRWLGQSIVECAGCSPPRRGTSPSPREVFDRATFSGDYEMRFGGSARVADSARPYQYYFRDEAEKTLAERIEKHNLTSANWHRAIWAGLT